MRKLILPVDAIVRDYHNGISSLALASKYRVDKATILRRLKHEKVCMRSLPEACRRFSLDTHFFEEINTEEKAYWLGFLLADGNVGYGGRYRKSRMLRVALQRRDEGHLIKLRTALSSNHTLRKDNKPRNKSPKNWNGCTWLCITSNELIKPLETMGWNEFKRNGDLRILQDIPNVLVRHVIRGLIDGDGCIGFSKEGKWHVSFVDLHKSVVGWLADNISSSGSTSHAKPTQDKGREAWNISYSGNRLCHTILRFLYQDCNFFLDRKLLLAKQALRTTLPQK